MKSFFIPLEVFSSHTRSIAHANKSKIELCLQAKTKLKFLGRARESNTIKNDFIYLFINHQLNILNLANNYQFSARRYCTKSHEKRLP